LERLIVLRPGPQRILRPGGEALLPVLNLGHGQAVLACGLRHRRLTPDNAQHQRYAALRRPSLHVLGHIRHRDPPLRGLPTTVVWVASTWRGAVYAILNPAHPPSPPLSAPVALAAHDHRRRRSSGP